MLLFFGGDVEYILPESRIIDIVKCDAVISVDYDGGEISLHYDSPEIASKVIKEFFAACKSGKGAFYFAPSVSVETKFVLKGVEA